MHYPRPPKSADEIARLPALGTTELEALVRDRGKEFAAETLVYLLRLAAGQHDTALFELCGRLLVGHPDSDGRLRGGHCEGIIVNLARNFGFVLDHEEMPTFRSSCYAELWKAIRGDRPFWESRFGMAFRQKCIEVARSMIRQRIRQLEQLDTAGGEVDVNSLANPARRIDEDVVSRLSAAHHQELLLAAIRNLPKRQSHAAFLAWIENRPVEGPGPGSIANLMEITPRMVYKHLAKAQEALQSNPAIRAIWLGEA